MKIHLAGFVLPALALLANAGALRAQEGEQEGETAQKPESKYTLVMKGEAAKVTNLFGEEVGVLRDHVVDRFSGRVSHVIVEHAMEGGRRQAVVPYEKLAWDAKRRQMLLPLTPEDLGRMAEYNPEELQSLGTDDRPAPAGTDGQDGEEPPVRNLLSSEIEGASLAAGDQPWGSVHALVMEPRRGQIAFALVQASASRRDEPATPIPWGSLQWSQESGFSTAATAEALSQAPKVSADDLKALDQPDTLAEIESLFPPARVRN